MKRLISLIVIAVLITCSFVSVAYPKYGGSKNGVRVKVCFSCTPRFFCHWGRCRSSFDWAAVCYLYSQIPFAPGGCCEEDPC